jgi:predicted nucleic acid-binding protein
MRADGSALIDTSAWILALRRGGSRVAREAVGQAIAEGTAATTGIVMLEILSGAKTQKEFRELHEDMQALIQLETTQHTWEEASRLAYTLRRKGVTVPATDVLVMTVAVEGRCTLLHADQHFELMAQHGVGLGPEEVQSVLV